MLDAKETRGIPRHSNGNTLGNGLKRPTELISSHMALAGELHSHSKRVFPTQFLSALCLLLSHHAAKSQLCLSVTSYRCRGLLLPPPEPSLPQAEQAPDSQLLPPGVITAPTSLVALVQLTGFHLQ